MKSLYMSETRVKKKMMPTDIINKQKAALMPVCKCLSRNFYIVNRMPHESEK